MKISDFFDNLNLLFDPEDEEIFKTTTRAVIFKNKDTGEVESIQIINPEYKEFIIIDREGNIECINISEEEQIQLTGKNSAKKKNK